MRDKEDPVKVRADVAANSQLDLVNIPDEELLGLRLSELPVRIEGTWLEPRNSSSGIFTRSSCYLADEWLTPENEPVIGVPFYLAHPRLIELQRKMMLE